MTQLRVGLDLSALDPNFKEHAQRGIGRYVSELRSYFDSNPISNLPISLGYFDHTHFKAGKVLDSLIQCAPLGRETIRQQLVYPLRLSRGSQSQFDVLHFPAHMDAPSWCPMPYLITVLDLIPLICRDLYEDKEASWRFKLARWLELRAIKNAERVLVISETTGKDVHRLLGIPWERISVTPLGVNAHFFREVDIKEVDELCVRFNINRQIPHILYVGGIDQRKNWQYMLEVLAQLRVACIQQGRVVPKLILAGRIEKDRQYPKLKSTIAKLDLEDLIVETGYVSDGDLPVLYHAASLFFFPSLYEGFGLPPLEALATGTAVVSSKTSVMPEVLGDCAEYIDPTDVSEGVLKVFQELFAVPQTETLREKRRLRASQFTWQRTGETTIKAYQDYAASLAR